MEKKQTLNNITLAGVLVNKELEVKEGINKETQQPFNYISGNVVVRTKDGSEISVDVYSKELTKEGKESSLYKGYVTIMEEYQTIKDNPEEPDVIKVGGANFTVNDYKSKNDNTLKSFNKVGGKFFNRLSDAEKETTPLEAKFEIEGVIDKIEDITKKDGVPTGDKRVIVNVLGYEGTITPVKLELPQPLVQPFLSMGYYEGGVTTLWGKVINTRKEEVITEQAGFGESNTKIVTTTISKNEITGGKPPYTLNEIGYTQEDYEQSKAKRKMKLDNILNNTTNTSTNNTTTQSNPFGNQQGATYNPFAQQ